MHDAKILPFISIALFLFKRSELEWKYFGFFSLARTSQKLISFGAKHCLFLLSSPFLQCLI